MNNKTIGIIALAGGDIDDKSINSSIEFFDKLGYKTKLSKNLFSNNRYLAGSDEDKIESLHNFFLDKDIDLIINARGGYGSIRLLNKIDYDIIRSNPKPFCGYSDITALLLMFYKKTGLTTYHGPMICPDFGLNTSEFTTKNFFNALNKSILKFKGTKIYNKGSAKGIIWGGNLSTIVSLCGLDFIPNENFIFFVEDLNEPVYKIDKMFTQLFNISQFKKYCKGIVLGDFLNVDNQDWLEDLFAEFTIPTVSGFKITHAQDKITIPIGKIATLSQAELVIG